MSHPIGDNLAGGQPVRGNNMKCDLISYMIPEGPPYHAYGAARGVTRCQTHDWQFYGSAQLQCPIGRIEEAADKAIAKIREARDAVTNG